MDGGSKDLLEVHDNLAAIDERTKEKGLYILGEFEKKRKKLGRGDVDQETQSVEALIQWKRNLDNVETSTWTFFWTCWMLLYLKHTVDVRRCEVTV